MVEDNSGVTLVQQTRVSVFLHPMEILTIGYIVRIYVLTYLWKERNCILTNTYLNLQQQTD